ncbi:ABC transporter ATP-binding protein [Roseomonas mucosa]|uniref:Spermidine/putrescine import ATP-binding protein PotA n=2 Tax=Bacteria TaxID=2 RepID=A0A379PNI3_9PROT|nr:ABC transporter ATP-binding protein [Roseomonas mucosa]SUE95401.1 Spermidine/putrescine import ATP-binding protein PotA [Roseomonas mucosa]
MPEDAATPHPENSGAEITLREITKRYGSHLAIDRLSLSIRRSEFISFLGPSGSGKSTTLMMIAGFETPESGQIALDGRDVTHLPPHRRGIGMVFQSYALFPHMTVAENVGFALKQRGVGKAEIVERVRQALDLVRLSAFGGRYPQQLSGGQQQRVAIARAVIFNPPVLLMDEPLSALDKQLREEMQLEIKALHERLGITFIYVTHYQKEALVMSDRVAVMNQGRIEQLDDPATLYDRPSNRFVASFVGEANFLPVEDMGVDRPGVRCVSLGGTLLRGTVASSAAPGQACMIRPEKIGILPAGSPVPPGRNHLMATVREVTFMGELTRCVLQLDAGGDPVVAKQQHRADAIVVRPQERVALTWAVEDTLLV